MLRIGAALWALLLLVTISGASARADFTWGVNGHPFASYPGVSFKQQLAYVDDLGMTSYRVDISTIQSAPRLEKLIAFARPRDIRILPVLTPGYDLDKHEPEQLYEWAHAFAVHLVSRFKDDIRVWELGNEMENYALIKGCETRDNGVQYDCEWGAPRGDDPLDYYGPRWEKVSAVLRGLSDGTNSVDPEIRRAMGTAGWGHVGAFERMREDGIEWDISVWHMYGEDPEWAFKKLAEFGKPIWVTEFNHLHGSQEGEIKQAKGLERWMARLRELGSTYDVEAAHIYELMDEPYWAPSFEAVMGLVRLEKNAQGHWTPGEAKPAYCAARKHIRDDVSVIRRQCDLCLFDSRDASARNKVAYSYCLVLGRPADGGGLESWAAGVEKGRDIREVLVSMIESGEFRETHDVAERDNSAYITLIYRLLLDRDPDGGGHADYLEALNQGELSRVGLAKLLMNSDEFRTEHNILFREAKDEKPKDKTKAEAVRGQ